MTRQAVGAIHESPADTPVANSQNLQHIAIAIRRLYRTYSVYRACLASISPFVPAGSLREGAVAVRDWGSTRDVEGAVPYHYYVHIVGATIYEKTCRRKENRR